MRLVQKMRKNGKWGWVKSRLLSDGEIRIISDHQLDIKDIHKIEKFLVNHEYYYKFFRKPAYKKMGKWVYAIWFLHVNDWFDEGMEK